MDRQQLRLILATVLLAGCSGSSALQAEEIASTRVAETAAAASPTAEPTATPRPTSTVTNTPEPTNTPVPTPTPLPPTPTPGPVVFYDDFSTDSGAWLLCDVCDWREGALFMGPFPANDTAPANVTFCEACGLPTYFRMAVDATYSEGYVDRGYGFEFGIGAQKELRFVITTLQIYVIVEFDQDASVGEVLKIETTGHLKPSKAMNHMEVLVEPTDSPGLATITFKINDKRVYILWNYPVEAAEVGLVVTYHALGIAFENFEFEEIES